MFESKARHVVSRGDIICPVCGKASYSLGGIHPQCAMERADAKRKKQLKAKEQASNKQKPKLMRSETVRWNTKKCPNCSTESHIRKRHCNCGYDFFAR
jgi:hypothetical protein